MQKTDSKAERRSSSPFFQQIIDMLRVTEEDRKPFGKLVGLGTLIIGVVMIVFGALFLAFEKTQNDAFVIVGVVQLLAGIAVGIIVTVYALNKYNKGIF